MSLICRWFWWDAGTLVSSAIGSHSLLLPARLLELAMVKKEVESNVTTKTATPTKVDSKLSDAHLELLKRREGGREGKCH
jgi:hypothetical protein